MAWASEDVTKLIAHIKQHPILYNRDLPNDAAAYAEAVEDVQMAVNKPWAMIKKKWSELRHYHKSIYFGYTKNKKQEQPKWKYYDMMAFAFDSLYQIQDDEVLSDEEDTSEIKSDATSPFNGFDDENVQSWTHGSKRVGSKKRKRSTTPTPTPLRAKRRGPAPTIVEEHSPDNATKMTKKTAERNVPGDANVIYIVKDAPDAQGTFTDYLDTIGFKLREIEQKHGQFEAKVAALLLHECICRFEKEAAERNNANNI